MIVILVSPSAMGVEERFNTSIFITMVTPDGNEYEIKTRRVLLANEAFEEKNGNWGFSFAIRSLSAEEYELSLSIFEKIKTGKRIDWTEHTSGETKGKFGAPHEYELESSSVKFVSSFFVTVAS